MCIGACTLSVAKFALHNASLVKRSFQSPLQKSSLREVHFQVEKQGRTGVLNVSLSRHYQMMEMFGKMLYEMLGAFDHPSQYNRLIVRYFWALANLHSYLG